MWARMEHERLASGTGRYTADLDQPGQAWLSVVRSPVAHGRIVDLDVGEAEQAPGVLAVLTARDLPGPPPTIPIRVVPTPAMQLRLQPVIAADRVRYVGEPVAVVVADDPYRAEDAAELVGVEVDPLEAVVDATVADPVSLWDPPLDNLLCTFTAEHGDVAAAFAAADLVVEGDFGVQRHTALPLEPRALTARWDGDGTLHLWGVVKYVHFTRRTVAGFFDLDPDDVVCHPVDVGGMFGSRGEVYPEDFLVPWAARRVGRPVMWVEDRREHLLSINHSREHHHRFAVALAADGTLLAFTDDATIDQGAYPRPVGGRLAQLTLEALPGPYRWQAYTATCRQVATTKTPAGTMRGPSTYEATFVRERALDIAAGRLGIDPIDLRRRNLIPRTPHRVELGDQMHALTYDTGEYPDIVDEILAAADLPAMRRHVDARRAGGELVGLGAAFFVDHSGLGREEHVRVDLVEDGTFRVATSGSEIGQGIASMVRRVAGATLGTPEELVEVITNDSRAQPRGGGTYASRSTVFVGSATVDGCTRLRREARALAADRLDADPATLVDVPDGFVFGDRHVHLKDLAPLGVDGVHRMEEPTFGFGLHLAVVRVAPDTAGVVVEVLHVGYDVGRAVDPESVEGQLRGATIHGLGGALLEELAYDADGQPLSVTFMDYLLPTASEAPDVVVHVLETEAVSRNPLGAKGAGEAGIMGVAPAVANAVADALGLDRMGADHPGADGADVAGLALAALPIRPDVVQTLLPAPRRHPA